MAAKRKKVSRSATRRAEVKTANPCLYVLARTDLVSLVPGKLAAQVSHATSQFEDWYQQNPTDLYRAWKVETGSFGTTIVLGANFRDIQRTVLSAGKAKIISGVVFDPTYPVRDGDVTHLVPLQTCAWLFGDKDDPALRFLVGGFELY